MPHRSRTSKHHPLQEDSSQPGDKHSPTPHTPSHPQRKRWSEKVAARQFSSASFHLHSGSRQVLQLSPKIKVKWNESYLNRCSICKNACPEKNFLRFPSINFSIVMTITKRTHPSVLLWVFFLIHKDQHFFRVLRVHLKCSFLSFNLSQYLEVKLKIALFFKMHNLLQLHS